MGSIDSQIIIKRFMRERERERERDLWSILLVGFRMGWFVFLFGFGLVWFVKECARFKLGLFLKVN